MDLFKLVGSIFIENDDANSKIESTKSKAESLASNLGSSMQKAGTAVTNAGKAFAPMSLLATGALTACAKSGSDFTNGMSKMSTLFDTTKYSVTDLSNQFLDLSNKTGLSATELAEAGYQALSAGVDVDKAVGFVETAGNLAKAGFTSTSTAVDVLTTAMNAYGEGAGTAEEISNKLVRTQNLGKTTVDELASSMGKIIPTASAMNVDINNLTSGYVSLTKQGIATAEATTYMNGMLNELGKSSTTVGKALQEETGKSFQDLMAEGKSLGDVLQILQDHADKTGVGFNELWGSAEAGKAGLAILNGGVEEFNDTVSIMKSNTDDVGEALDKLNTPSVQAQKALNQIKNSATQLGQTLLTSIAPAFTKVCDAITKATTWFSNLDEGTKKTIMTIMGVVAVISPLLIGVGKLITFVGTIITTVQTLIPVFTSLNAVMLANPVGIIIVAIGALIAIFVALWNKCEGFRNFWIGLWEGIKNVVSVAIEGIKTFFSGIIDFVKNNWQGLLLLLVNPFAGAFKLLYDNCEGFRNFVDKILDGLKNAISTAWETIKNVVQVAGMFIVELVKAWFNLITLPFRFIWENCKDTIMEVWNAIHDWFSAKIEAISQFFINAFNAIKDFFTTIWEAIKGVFTAVWDAIHDYVSQRIQTIKTVLTTVMEAIKTVFTTIWEAIKNVFTTVWDAIKTKVDTVTNAINTTITTVWNAIKTTVTNVLNTIKTTVTNVWDGIKTKISTVIDSVKSTVSNGFNAVKSTISNVLNTIKTTFSNIWNTCKNTVSNAINSIKSAMNFEWHLPHLKLPHFNISGKFSLDPPSVPSFGIEWYKNGGILNDATMFGLNPFNGKAMVGGEAGAEAIAPLDTLLGYIRTAVAEQNASLIQSLKDSIHDLGDMIGSGSVGDVVVPVYLGNNLIDELVVDSRKRVLVRSGGMTNV